MQPSPPEMCCFPSNKRGSVEISLFGRFTRFCRSMSSEVCFTECRKSPGRNATVTERAAVGGARSVTVAFLPVRCKDVRQTKCQQNLQFRPAEFAVDGICFVAFGMAFRANMRGRGQSAGTGKLGGHDPGRDGNNRVTHYHYKRSKQFSETGLRR